MSLFIYLIARILSELGKSRKESIREGQKKGAKMSGSGKSQSVIVINMIRAMAIVIGLHIMEKLSRDEIRGERVTWSVSID